METSNKDGDRKVLYILGDAALFPMVSFTEKHVMSSWFYAALVDSELYVIPYEKFTATLKEVDGFTAYNTILGQMLKEVHELLLHISDHTKTNSDEKLISMLFFLLAHHTKKISNVWRLVRFPVTHQFLADMTGLTRETVSLTLKTFTEKKLIRYKEKGRLELHYDNLTKYNV